MRFLLLLLTVASFSCRQNDTKQKELELKEKELALKEKELKTKENDNSIITQPDSSKEKKFNNKTPIINPLKITKHNISSIFPVIELSDMSRAEEINSYMISETMIKNEYRELVGVTVSNLKTSLMSAFDGGIVFKYKVKLNTKEKIILRITWEESTDTGTNLHYYDFAFDLNTGDKKVNKIIGHNDHISDDYSE